MRGLRFSFYNALLLLTAVSFLFGKGWLWFGFVFLLCASVIGDRIFSEDHSEVVDPNPILLNTLLYSILPLLTFNVMAFIWQMGSGDWLGVGHWVGEWVGVDILQHRADRGGFDSFGGIMSLGLLCASAGTNVAHELVHRTRNKTAMGIGRWLLSFTFDTSFSIEHVYGHHANIATFRDPASARRGENVFAFLVRSTFGSFMSGWHLEGERLRKKKLPTWTWQNRFLRGQLMSLAVLCLFYAGCGWYGVGLGVLVGVFGKSYLEVVNYIEHYGLVRVPGTPVLPKHSWNSNHRVSSLLLYNLPRHSHHHAKGSLPFWKLKPMPDAPTLPYGYMSMILLALVPPIYKKVMHPLLEEWDRQHASPAEKQLLGS